MGRNAQIGANCIRYVLKKLCCFCSVTRRKFVGIKKLVMTCTIVDSLVLMEDITDAIEKLEDFVQSVNIASMNKIS